MRHRLAAALIALSTISAVAAPSTQGIPFAWRLAELGGRPDQRVAIAVTALLDGRPCAMQLDTGLDSAVAWNGAAPSVREGSAKVRVEFAGVTRFLAATPARLAELADCTTDTNIGSLGNGFFDQGSLRIDLKAARIAYVPGSTLRGRAEAQPMFYARWGDDGGHVLVETRHEGSANGYAMLDTGTAAADLAVLSLDQWQRDTGDAPLHANAQVRRFEVQAWGRMHECFAATGKQAIDVGDRRLRSPEISYCPDLGFDLPLRIDGVLGMHALGDAVITIDYVSGRWALDSER